MPHASPEARRRYRQKWYRRNRTKQRRYARKWARDNAEHVRANRARWRKRTRRQRQLFRAANKPIFLLYHVRERARKAKLAFDLKVTDLTWPNVCPVFGFDLDYGAREPMCPYGPSLDRLDPRGGYTKDNVRVISWRANELKRNGNIEEFAALLKWMRREIR